MSSVSYLPNKPSWIIVSEGARALFIVVYYCKNTALCLSSLFTNIKAVFIVLYSIDSILDYALKKKTTERMVSFCGKIHF